MVDKSKLIINVLKSTGILTDAQIKQALDKQQETKERLSKILVDLGFIANENIGDSFSSQFGIVPTPISSAEIREELIEKIGTKQANGHRVVPLSMHDKTMVIATDNYFNFLAQENLSKILSSPIELILASKDDINRVLKKYYGMEKEAIMSMIAKMDESEIDFLGDAKALPVTAEEAPIIKLVSAVILEAFRSRASDIHLEPLADKFCIRYRIDGVLHEIPGPPRSLQAATISRIKLMAGMNIAEHRLPQDGRIRITVAGKELDLRVSTLPAIYGESLVMRILDKSSLVIGLKELGFLADDEAQFEELLHLPNGIILVTGPTGSGKTTTLYAALNYVNKPDRKIITIEDPIEYQLSGINQVQVKPQVEMTFARGLRAMLRQAPDIIMVGEIRDMETASIAIQASLTGHLIFSTLHTNDASGAVTRLSDMGIKPYLVAASVQAILAQRLIRTICTKCKTSYKPTPEEIAVLGHAELLPIGKEQVFYRGAGCKECSQTGYKGRIGIFELLVVDENIKELVFTSPSSADIRKKARSQGMRTLREDGIRKVLTGMTTVEEILRVTQGDVD